MERKNLYLLLGFIALLILGGGQPIFGREGFPKSNGNTRSPSRKSEKKPAVRSTRDNIQPLHSDPSVSSYIRNCFAKLFFSFCVRNVLRGIYIYFLIKCKDETFLRKLEDEGKDIDKIKSSMIYCLTKQFFILIVIIIVIIVANLIFKSNKNWLGLLFDGIASCGFLSLLYVFSRCIVQKKFWDFFVCVMLKRFCLAIVCQHVLYSFFCDSFADEDDWDRKRYAYLEYIGYVCVFLYK